MFAPIVQTGLDRLVAESFTSLRGLKIGLVANHATVDSRLQHIADLLGKAPKVTLAAIFGPEHGFDGEAQDLIAVGGVAQHPRYKCPLYSLYGDSAESLFPLTEQFDGLDALVIDLPDIGTRFYTFQATMLKCLQVASKTKLPVVVLDRPNPIGGTHIEGPSIEEGFDSFVGAYPIPIRHGLTLGELALFYKGVCDLEVPLHVMTCEGWKREMIYDETGLPWVLPSPNMPSVETAIVYPGQCLIEGTNLSEGRGTTRPFELCGAPWINPYQLADQLNAYELPGIRFRPTTFKPTFQKFVGQKCGGVQLHVTDREAFRPVRTSTALLAAFIAQSGDQFRWRTEVYEFIDDKPAIDILYGSSRERKALHSGLSFDAIVRPWAEVETAFRAHREPYLLY